MIKINLLAERKPTKAKSSAAGFAAANPATAKSMAIRRFRCQRVAVATRPKETVSAAAAPRLISARLSRTPPTSAPAASNA